jgi:hypothetical protein
MMGGVVWGRPMGLGSAAVAGRFGRFAKAMIGVEPFRRLVVAQLATTAADALFTVSLAGSLFFSVSVGAARPRVLLYLLLTLAPFAVVGPFVGPIVDRLPGGQRVLIAISNAGRAAACLLIASHLTTLLLFPLAFAVLVLAKSSSVAKSALVPWLVRDQAALVAANAQLSGLTTVTGGVALAAGAGLLAVAGAPAVLVAAAVGYLCATVLALRIPRPQVRLADPAVDEVGLRAAPLRLAANAMTVLRAAVGFLTFLLAFNLRVAGEPTWVFGVAIAAGGAGGFAGTFVAAAARRRVSEETILAAAVATPGVVAVLGAVQYRRSSALLASFAVGMGASVGRQAFDSTTQRLAPDAEKGRAFARFETQFQLAWVLGALGPVLGKFSSPVGLATLGLFLCGAGALYATAVRAVRRNRVVVGARLDPAHGDVSESMLSLASGLRAEGAERVAVLTAVGAVRAARTAASTPDGDAIDEELAALWREAATGTGPLPQGAAERAIALARLAVRASGTTGRPGA